MISLFDISNSIFGNKLHALICANFSEPFFKLGLPDTIFGPGFDSICPINRMYSVDCSTIQFVYSASYFDNKRDF